VLKEFRSFVLRGSVVDLAVAVVIGAAFGAVVTSMVENIFTPVIGMIGDFDFAGLEIKARGERILYGLVLNALISFVLISAAVFFFAVKPINALLARRRTQPEVESVTKKCTECLSDIPKDARRCAFCTSSQEAA
jgi:large conductance mechanosensitive channel